MKNLWVLSAVLLAGCFQAPEEGAVDGGVDAGSHDAGTSHDAGVTDAGTRPDAGVFLYGAVKPDCAPNDGPAFRFVLSDVPVDCSYLDSASEGFYVWLWAAELQPRSYSLAPDLSSEGQACLCGVVANQALGGSVTLDVVTDAGVSGRIDATFMSGSQRHDAFQVLMCPGLRQCG
jgi:hypothetical protein